MAAYYNEIDKFAAAWLRELVKAGQIADGEVDERSIVDVRPDDLRGFRQCHFFAGVGGWSLALRRAGWPDDRRCWTGSCPCQPFSAAGAGGGFADERHLWPSWHWLIEQCRPDVVWGEQVESPAGRTWLDLVCTDLEGAGYACWPSDLPVAGVGAPGIRQRLFWVADQQGGRLGIDRCASGQSGHVDQREPVVRMAHGGCDGLQARRPSSSGLEGWPALAEYGSNPVRLVDRLVTRLEGHTGDGNHRCESRRLDADAARSVAATGATRGLWADADWLYCRDEKFRPVEPGTFPLASGVPARVGRLRGYGNSINPEIAAAFIESYLEVEAAR